MRLRFRLHRIDDKPDFLGFCDLEIDAGDFLGLVVRQSAKGPWLAWPAYLKDTPEGKVRKAIFEPRPAFRADVLAALRRHVDAALQETPA